jgi:hypothetical protein
MEDNNFAVQQIVYNFRNVNVDTYLAGEWRHNTSCPIFWVANI